MKKQDRAKYCLDWIHRIQQENEVLNQERAKALQFLRADPEIVEAPENTSKATTTDLRDAIEWIKPSLSEIFTGGDEVTRLEPTGQEDVIPVKNMEILTNYQVRVKNPWFKIFHDWVDDALTLKTGVVKYQWYSNVKFVEKQYGGPEEELSVDEYNALLLQVDKEYKALTNEESQEAPDEFVKGVQPIIDSLTGGIVGYHKATFVHVFKDEYPLIEAIPTEDFAFPHKLTREIEDSPFVYHRARYTKQKFIKKYGKGKFNEVKDTLETLTDKTSTGGEHLVILGRLADLGTPFIQEKGSGEYSLYECFYFDPDTDEPVITTICGQTELNHQANRYDKPPFVVVSLIRTAHRVCGLGMYDLMKDIQRIRTAMLREMLNNLYFGNKSRTFINERVNIEDFEDNRPGIAIRVSGHGNPADAASPEIKAPLPDGIFNLFELMNLEKDVHSGIPRSYQGVNPRVLNKTWRGQNQQVSQASMRITMMARVMAEIGVSTLIREIINLNLKFLKKKQAIRYLNTWVDISPENIVGQYDVSVGVGLGTGNKEQTIAQMQQLLAIQGQMFKAGIPIVSSRNAYNVMKELLKAMGYKNTGDFVENPEYLETVQQLVALLIQGGAVQNPNIGRLVAKLSQHIGGTEVEGTPDTAQEGDNPASNLLGRMSPRQPMNPFVPEAVGDNGEEHGY